jgi:uncharacterized membrane protein
MSDTIGNPLSWSVDHAKAVGQHLGAAATHVGHGEVPDSAMPRIRHLAMRDLREVLRRGVEDFVACRTDVIFVCLLYPVIGGLLAWIAFHNDLLPLLFPITSGFALLGPIAAIGLYEMSRRRELGEDPDWAHAFAFTRSPSFAAIFVLGLMLGALFIVWVLTANGIYYATFGDARPASIGAFVGDVFTSKAGWTMIVVGIAVGALFATLVLACSVVSFPLLLDRDVGLPVAVITSMRVTAANPGPVAAWGLIVAAGLVLGSIPFFLGLIVVMPILGHATWHLYRRTVVAGPHDT